MHLAKIHPADLFDKAGRCRACQWEELRLHFPALLQKREKKQTTVPRSSCMRPIGKCGDRAKASRNGVRNPDARAQATKDGARQASVEKKRKSQPQQRSKSRKAQGVTREELATGSMMIDERRLVFKPLSGGEGFRDGPREVVDR